MPNRRQFLTAASTLPLGLMLTGAHAQSASGPNSLDAIKQRKVLRFGAISQEPWFIKDPVSQQWQGVAIEMGKAMAKELGVTFTPVETTWANAVAGLQAGQVDIQFLVEPTAARREVIDFTQTPVFYYAMGALLQTSMKDVQTWEHLDNPQYRIGVPLGSNIDALMTARLPKAQIVRLQTTDEIFAAFASRRIDAVMQYHPTLLVAYSRLRMGRLIVPQPTLRAQTYAGLPKAGDTAFRDWASAFVTALTSSGQTDKMLEQYIAGRGVSADLVKQFTDSARPVS